jgi:hypothetical protein
VWIVNLRHRVIEEYRAPGFNKVNHLPGESTLEVAGAEVDSRTLFENLPESD